MMVLNENTHRLKEIFIKAMYDHLTTREEYDRKPDDSAGRQIAPGSDLFSSSVKFKVTGGDSFHRNGAGITP
jgi:hypothetical protein